MADLTAAELTDLQTGMTESQQAMFQSQYATLKKDRTMGFLIAWFLGSVGGDRFWLGDTQTAVLKLITFGGCGIWTLIDLLSIMDRVDTFNRGIALDVAETVRNQSMTSQ